jgi:hypothetical protein
MVGSSPPVAIASARLACHWTVGAWQAFELNSCLQLITTCTSALRDASTHDVTFQVNFVNAVKRTALIIAACLTLGACASTPTTVEKPAPAPPAAPLPPPTPAQESTVYAYPLRNQTLEQQDRDRYECHLWAVKQSGFDPSAPSLPPHTRVRVVSAPQPPSSVPGAAITGAILGAIIGGPFHGGPGAAVGAVAGAAVGAASDAQHDQRTQAIEQQHSEMQRSRDYAVERKAEDYRRAIAACFAGRGYSTQ